MAWARPRNVRRKTVRCQSLSMHYLEDFFPVPIHLAVGVHRQLSAVPVEHSITCTIVSFKSEKCCRPQWVFQVKVSSRRGHIMWVQIQWIVVWARRSDAFRNVLVAEITALYLDFADTRKYVCIEIVGAPSVSSSTNGNASWQRRSVSSIFPTIYFFLHECNKLPFTKKSQQSTESLRVDFGITVKVKMRPEAARPKVGSNWFNSFVNICLLGFVSMLGRYSIWPVVSSAFAQKHILFDKNVYILPYSFHTICGRPTRAHTHPPSNAANNAVRWISITRAACDEGTFSGAHLTLFTRLTRNENKTVIVSQRCDSVAGWKTSAAITINTMNWVESRHSKDIYIYFFFTFLHVHRLRWNDNKPLKMRLQCDLHRTKLENQSIHCRQAKSTEWLSRNRVRRLQRTWASHPCGHRAAPGVCHILKTRLVDVFYRFTPPHHIDNPASSTMSGRISESAIDMLAHLFPHRKRSVLELILRRCDLDLLKAIEQCRPTPSAFKPLTFQVKSFKTTDVLIFHDPTLLTISFRFDRLAEDAIAIDFVGAKVHRSVGNSGNSSFSHISIIVLCSNASGLSEVGIPDVDTVFNGSDSSPPLGQLGIQMRFHQLPDVRVSNRKVLMACATVWWPAFSFLSCFASSWSLNELRFFCVPYLHCFDVVKSVHESIIYIRILRSCHSNVPSLV